MSKQQGGEDRDRERAAREERERRRRRQQTLWSVYLALAPDQQRQLRGAATGRAERRCRDRGLVDDCPHGPMAAPWGQWHSEVAREREHALLELVEREHAAAVQLEHDRLARGGRPHLGTWDPAAVPALCAVPAATPTPEDLYRRRLVLEAQAVAIDAGGEADAW